MRRILATLCCLPLAMPLLAAEVPPAAEEPKSLGEALAAGTFRLGLRYRYENVADDARPDRDARASTLRTAPGWESVPYRGLSFHLEGAVGKVRWTVVPHEFGADSGGADYGRELDLQLLYTTPWEQTVGLKAALYDADAFSTDTEKWILWTSYGI